MKPARLTNQDDELILKLVQFVMENLQNEQFGVSELAQMAGLSRSYLHRKLSLIKNQSISQFIREVRLKEAYKLLKKELYTASEVAYKVGFNNPSYFNKCFNEYYGFSPGETKHHITNNPLHIFRDREGPDREVPNKLSIAFKAPSDKSLRQRKLKLYLSVVILGVVLTTMLLLWSIRNQQKLAVESVLVLPFDNYTGDEGLEYFISGMHSSLIGDMGKLSGLRIISQTSSKAFKNEGIPLKDIAKELHVDAVVESAVTCLGDSICVQFRVIQVFPEEKQIWAGNFQAEKSLILSVYSKATKKIAEEINVSLTPFEEKLLSGSLPVKTQAYDDYMMGLYYLDMVNKSSIDSAIEYFNTARMLDPHWALPYAGLTQAWAYHMQMGFHPPSEAIPYIYVNLNKALELDPNSANSHYIKGIIAVWTEWDWEKGESEFKRAIELNPSHALSRITYAHLLMILHRNKEARKQSGIGAELDPLRPFVLAMHARTLLYTGEIKPAKKFIEKALEIDPDHRFAKGTCQFYYYTTDDYENWFKIWKEKQSETDSSAIQSIEKTFYEKGYISALEEIIQITEEYNDTAGGAYSIALAHYYLQMKNYEKALELLHEGYDFHDPNMPYASTKSFESEKLKDYPLYIDLMKKMNLPVD